MTYTSRMNLEKLMFDSAELIATQATCPRKSVGCVLVDIHSYSIVATGYNGAPEELPKCTEEGCIDEGGHCVRSVHAEIRALANSARRYVRLDGCVAYCTLLPCINCMQALMLAGIHTIFYDESYDRGEKEHLFRLAKLGAVYLIERNRS